MHSLFKGLKGQTKVVYSG